MRSERAKPKSQKEQREEGKREHEAIDRERREIEEIYIDIKERR